MAPPPTPASIPDDVVASRPLLRRPSPPPEDDETELSDEDRSSDGRGPGIGGGETRRHLLGLFGLGLVNNSSFVIMAASAKSLMPNRVGLVYVCSSVPSFALRLSAPYWLDRVSYRARVFLMIALMPLGYTSVALAQGHPTLQLLGILCTSAQQGLGEVSALALSSRFSNRSLTAWSSGTGLAGLFGYAWVLGLGLGLGLDTSAVLLMANVLTLAFVAAVLALSPPPAVGGAAEGEVVRTSLDFRERLHLTARLWPWTVPLCVVYFAEYAMQSGAWSAIGFPPSSSAARDRFYAYANTCYQGGVFVSRSSGVLYRASTRELWLMPCLQLGLLAFFLLVAQYHFWYDPSLLALCFASGLAGGITYVNGFRLIQDSVEPYLKELATAGGAISSDLGTLLGEIVGIGIQAYLYRVNEIHE